MNDAREELTQAQTDLGDFAGRVKRRVRDDATRLEELKVHASQSQEDLDKAVHLNNRWNATVAEQLIARLRQIPRRLP